MWIDVRQLNYWVVGSVVLAFVTGGYIGWIVTRVGCADGTCAGAAVVIGLTAGFVAAAGVGVVVVLASRSMDEWRTADQTDRSTPEEGPSNEVRSDEQ